MKKMSTASIAGESKCAMPASRVEKPPSATALKPWFTASNQPMPANRKASMQVSVSAAYESHSALAVSVMRGVSLSL
jgi:hypothetical protein